MKRFELVIEWDGNGLRMNAKNDGFNILELIALLDVNKSDIVEQFTKHDNFTSHRIVRVGDQWEEIERKGGE